MACRCHMVKRHAVLTLTHREAFPSRTEIL